jgi:hypothetical protein
MVTGISSDSYLLLEQCRERNPSIQVLEALARVLGLDQAATAYLLGLTTPRHATVTGEAGGRPRPPAQRETVPVGIRQLLSV